MRQRFLLGRAQNSLDGGFKNVMNETFDIYTLIFLGLAVFVVLRLRSVLGRRTGNERPPFDPYSRTDNAPSPRETADPASSENKVLDFPDNRDKSGDAETAEEAPKAGQIDRLAPKGSAVNEALQAILAVDRHFEPAEFMAGAKSAYEMIVMAFAEGDKPTLEMLLARDVYEGFSTAIDERQARGESIEQTFVGLESADILEAQLEEDEAQITLRFRCQLIAATRDRESRIVDGDPNKVSDVVDIWTFARDISSRDPNWRLIATQSAE